MSGQENRSVATKGIYARFGKRILDILIATAALVIAGPILLACAAAIYLETPGPIFYRQVRVGQTGKPFRIRKLRTMVFGADSQGPRLTASGDPRITRIGRILRKAKLDELPQLLNVLHGEMSLVGPRPELPEFVAKYTSQERKILDLKPGITGPASVSYIDEEKLLATVRDREAFYINQVMRAKLQVDLAYCRRVSLLGDFNIILRTAAALSAIFSWKRLLRHLGVESDASNPGSESPLAGGSSCTLPLVERNADNEGAVRP